MPSLAATLQRQDKGSVSHASSTSEHHTARSNSSQAGLEMTIFTSKVFGSLKILPIASFKCVHSLRGKKIPVLVKRCPYSFERAALGSGAGVGTASPRVRSASALGFGAPLEALLRSSVAPSCGVCRYRRGAVRALAVLFPMAR